jgi:hypothetical protein
VLFQPYAEQVVDRTFCVKGLTDSIIWHPRNDADRSSKRHARLDTTVGDEWLSTRDARETPRAVLIQQCA